MTAPGASHARAAERTDQVDGSRPQLAQAHVHAAIRRLPPVAVAFKRFLMEEGAGLIEKITRVKELSVYKQ